MRSRALIAASLLAGCIATPVPEPPNADAMRIEPGTSVVILEGEPGAVAAGADLWVVDLDNTAPPRVVAAAADGSFSAQLDGAAPGDTLRLQTRLGAARSAPVDVTTPELTPPPRPLGGCLTLEPATEVDLAEVAIGESATVDVAVRNDCGGAIVWGAVALRTGAAGFTVEAPADVPIDEVGAVRIRFAPTVGGAAEDVLLLPVSGPSSERRAVNVYGRGRAP